MPSLSDFKKQVQSLDGVRLVTKVRQRGFTLGVSAEGLEYIPESSGFPRPDAWNRIESVLDRFNETGSSQPGDYKDLTHHASYVLAILAHLLGDRRSGTDRAKSIETAAVQPGVTQASGALRRPNQRVGAVSNAHVGREFERVALEYFRGEGVELESDFPVELGLAATKIHRFDLGSERAKILVECKSHRWTAGDKVPSAKMTVWNEAMFYFLLAPDDYRKCFFVLHHRRGGTGESLVDYYRRTYPHLISDEVEFLEWDEATGDLVIS